MAKFKMKQLALAMGTILGGMSLVPSVQAVNLATDGLGQVLIFPYYTTRVGWNTLFNITNTSDEVVAIKVRFHEGYNSRDVFDFNVILSPHDVWNGTLSNGAGDVPNFSTSDTTCAVPAIPAGGQLFQGSGANGLLAYTGAAADGGPITTDRMREGYVSVIMMGTSPVVGLAADAVHTAAGVPANCAALVNAFSLNGTTIAGLRAAFPNYAVNPLKGAFSLVNATSGWNASGEAVTLADFWVPPVPGTNLITAQLPPAQVGNVYTDSFHQPELSSANTSGEVLLANGAPVSTDAPTTGADAVSFVLQRSSVVNQWANLPAGVAPWTVMSDQIVTFPTKRFYVDEATHEFAGRAAGRPGLPAGRAPFTNAFAGKSCDAVSYSIYNREEKLYSPVTGPVFSPAPTPEGNTLCQEVNVLTFGAATDATQTNVLGSPMPNALSGNIPAANLPGENGWMQLNFLNAATALPVVGFAVINRTDSAGGLLNESFVVNNAYIR
ncbi:MAG: hypothetical protein KDJ22_01405 [Candidatus Competibacteraceae bacterium]|nr:hypothetical protein [Candidatus Competibacteraceae bacterium]MCP5125355.1 hypothetical protein [Gammaproteobacteria bacterium]